MLIKFEVENYRSFYDKASFDTASRNKSENSELHYLNTFLNERTKDNYVKSSMLVGKNAGGKSNFIVAIQDYILMIVRSFNNKTVINTIQPFRLLQDNQKPIAFSCEFLQDDNWYKYSFSIKNNKIHEEKLEVKVKIWSPVFHRKESSYKSIYFPKKYQPSFGKLLEHTKDDVLFLSVLNQFNVRMAVDIVGYFIKNYTVVMKDFITDISNTEEIISSNDDILKNEVLNFIMSSDLGISNIYTKLEKRNLNDKVRRIVEIIKAEGIGEVETSEEVTKLYFDHKVYDNNFTEKGFYPFKNEFVSDGTNRMVELAGPLFSTLKSGGVMFIDEIDYNLHHILVKKIVELFNSIDINKKNAQLIFTSHNLLLLDEDIRRDQIWVVDKNEYNQSRMYNLTEIPGITKKTNILKQYLLGMYRGVPELDTL